MYGIGNNEEYDFKTKYPYKLTTQLCTLKQSNSSKISLVDARSDLPKLKFPMKLGKPVNCVTDYDKEEFLQAI